LATIPLTFGQAKGDDNTGLKGSTIFVVFGGAEGAGTRENTFSMEFAIAPVAGDSPVYEKAIMVKSDEQGKFEICLPPGKYWIGPKKKALDPKNFKSTARGPTIFIEKVVTVKKDGFTHVDVILEGHAP